MLKMRPRWTEMRKFSLPPRKDNTETETIADTHTPFCCVDSSLCLRIFRGLGFLPSKNTDTSSTTTTPSTAEEWASILVRSDTRNTAIQFDIQTAHLKQNEISPLILADQLWKAAE